MSGHHSFSEPIPIGEVAAPPAIRLPQPEVLFAERAERLRGLADGHGLAPYLKFLADLSAMQRRILTGLPRTTWPSPEAIAHAVTAGTPPLDRGGFLIDAAFAATWDRLATALRQVAMPDPARVALARIDRADDEARAAFVRNLLADAVPAHAFAEHALMAAALQVHFTRIAAGLDAKGLKASGGGTCPVCAGPPVASLIVGWVGAHGTRYCACGLCGTLWNYVRIKCTLCGSTGGIAYQGIDGGPDIATAETCDRCRGYVKILHQDKEPALDPIADDVATVALDLLVCEAGYRRGAFNPFLLGY